MGLECSSKVLVVGGVETFSDREKVRYRYDLVTDS